MGDTNDLFASIGGSLMKDLFEDLNIDDEKDLFSGGNDSSGMGWSLDQLEKELLNLEAPQTAVISAPPASALPPPPGLSSAASLVVPTTTVTQKQQQPSGGLTTTPITTTTSAASAATSMQADAADAWSQSLAQFTQMSGLEQDFLAADSARKQSKHPTKTGTGEPDLSFLDGATDYDVSENVTLASAPPPGLAGPPGLLSPSALKQPPTAVTTPKKTDEKPTVVESEKKEEKPAVPAEKKEKQKPKAKQQQQQQQQKQQRPQEKAPTLLKKEDAKQAIAKAKATNEATVPEIPKPLPPTPQNSLAGPQTPKPLPPTPQNSFNLGAQPSPRAPPPQQHQQPPPPLPPQVIAQLQAVQRQGAPPHVLAQMHAAAVQQHMQRLGQQPLPPGVMPPPQPMMIPTTPNQKVQPPPPRTPGNVWNRTPQPAPQVPQTPPARAQYMMPPPAAQRIYCQSHPKAPPIPAKVLESSFMKSRDIAYVLHAMLRPVLMMGTSTSDYDIQLLLKQHHQAIKASKPVGVTPKKKDSGNKNKDESEGKDGDDDDNDEDDSNKKLLSPSLKFMQERSTLGHTARADVTRPKALIAAGAALNTAADDEDGDDKEKLEARKSRATLWKSRIYVDKAYQSYAAICDIWKRSTQERNASGGGGERVVPHEELQPHMLRLFKYLGIKKATAPNNEGDGNSSVQYEVEIQSLQLFMKLPKGRVLLARILEQALLPPNAVQALLQPTLNVILSSKILSSTDANDSVALTNRTIDDRLFCVLTQVLSGLPTLTNDILLECAKTLLEYAPKESLASTRRMECVHSVLRRGSDMSSADSTFKKEWTTTEEQFLTVLGSM